MADVRLIDANEAYEAVTELSGQADTKSAYAAFWKAGKVIRNLPTVDSAPVVHGRWINETTTAKGVSIWRFVCSACGHIFYNAGIDNFNFCPNCGAKMDLEVPNG